MSEFIFSNLSLAGITASAGAGVLKPGRYVCKVADVKLADTKAKTGKILKVVLRCDDGVITDNINVANPNPEAVKFGLEGLKSLLVNGGHPDPDNIGRCGMASIKGLTVGVIVKASTYNGNPTSEVGGFFNPEEGGNQPSKELPKITDMTDDIPF